MNTGFSPWSRSAWPNLCTYRRLTELSLPPRPHGNAACSFAPSRWPSFSSKSFCIIGASASIISTNSSFCRTTFTLFSRSTKRSRLSVPCSTSRAGFRFVPNRNWGLRVKSGSEVSRSTSSVTGMISNCIGDICCGTLSRRDWLGRRRSILTLPLVQGSSWIRRRNGSGAEAPEGRGNAFFGTTKVAPFH